MLLLGHLSHTLSSVLTHSSPSPSPKLSPSLIIQPSLCAVILTLYYSLPDQADSTVPPLSHKLTHTHEHEHTYGAASNP